MAIKAVEKRKKRLSFTILSIISFFWVMPVIWVISTSFKSEREAVRGELNLIPREFSLEGYRFIFTDDNHNILHYIRNSFIAATGHTLLYLLIASLAAYGYGILRFKGRDKIFWLLISTMMIPAVMNLIPLYSIMIRFEWLNRLQALIIPGLGGIFGIFLLRQFNLTIPRELIESAHIDGANNFQIYLRIILPLTKPALIVVGLFSFMGNWNDYLWPLIVLHDNSVRTLPVGLALMQGTYNIYYARLMAATVVSIIPVLALFLASQRFFIKGITMTGIKQ
ncbi:MAG: carbohydrate ABC transporter permease [Candidatus Izemoplasmataceae bacterium]|jgi:multiple sugar transport system permease protein|uniref:carbohydrate ABC transporter permease n=1 Tax=Liberiplasma polymorphum TaxID=3374570 RepID=UPI0037769B01